MTNTELRQLRSWTKQRIKKSRECRDAVDNFRFIVGKLQKDATEVEVNTSKYTRGPKIEVSITAFYDNLGDVSFDAMEKRDWDTATIEDQGVQYRLYLRDKI